MFDFNKIGMNPSDIGMLTDAEIDSQIIELEKHCCHPLPRNYKALLKKYNGGEPDARYFEVIDEKTGVPLQRELYKFYDFDHIKETPETIWWIIENYKDFLGPNTLPFAEDAHQQIYFFKWIDNIPQIWFLAYLDLEKPETCFVMNSFDELLGALYVAD